jgi:hypothetical protein
MQERVEDNNQIRLMYLNHKIARCKWQTLTLQAEINLLKAERDQLKRRMLYGNTVEYSRSC